MPLPTRLALVAHRFTTRICLQKKLQYASTLESRVRSEVRKQQHRLQFLYFVFPEMTTTILLSLEMTGEEKN